LKIKKNLVPGFFLKIQNNKVTIGSSFMEIFKEPVIRGSFHCQWNFFELLSPSLLCNLILPTLQSLMFPCVFPHYGWMWMANQVLCIAIRCPPLVIGPILLACE
jgi:hypothetical protein